MNNKIDFVVCWVDGSDPSWIKEKNKYLSPGDQVNISASGDERFKDTGLFKYWFRGVQKYAPWVNHIYLVTNGQVPEWLNLDNPKITLIKHSDIIAEKYLPTFNSCAISLCLHKIPKLSERFVFFNDDMFLINPTKPTDFFKHGLPCDMAVQGILTPSNSDMFWKIRAKLLNCLNANYSKSNINHNFFKWFNLKYGMKYLARNIILKKYPYFTDLYNPHIPHSYLKESYVEVWNKYSNEINETLSTKFREQNNIFEWLIRYIQLVKGNFCPTNLDKIGFVADASENNVEDYVLNKNIKTLCINGNATDFKLERIKRNFDLKLCTKCDFER